MIALIFHPLSIYVHCIKARQSGKNARFKAELI